MEPPKPPVEWLATARAACTPLWSPFPAESGMAGAVKPSAFSAAFRAQFELFALLVWIQISGTWDRALAAAREAVAEELRPCAETWVREVYEAEVALEVLGLWYPWIYTEEELVLDTLDLVPGLVPIQTVAKIQLLAQWYRLSLVRVLIALKERVGHPPLELKQKVVEYQAFATKLVFGSGRKLTGTELAALLQARRQ